MILFDVECCKCGNCYSITEFGFEEGTRYYTDDNSEKFLTLDDVECPDCRSTEKEVHDDSYWDYLDKRYEDEDE